MYSIVEILNVNKIMHVYQNLHSTSLIKLHTCNGEGFLKSDIFHA